jgi:hypothetical protein
MDSFIQQIVRIFEDIKLYYACLLSLKSLPNDYVVPSTISAPTTPTTTMLTDEHSVQDDPIEDDDIVVSQYDELTFRYGITPFDLITSSPETTELFDDFVQNMFGVNQHHTEFDDQYEYTANKALRNFKSERLRETPTNKRLRKVSTIQRTLGSHYSSTDIPDHLKPDMPIMKSKLEVHLAHRYNSKKVSKTRKQSRDLKCNLSSDYAKEFPYDVAQKEWLAAGQEYYKFSDGVSTKTNMVVDSFKKAEIRFDIAEQEYSGLNNTEYNVGYGAW